MAVFKCKMCGGTVSIDSSTNIATCDYCGSKQTFPQFSEETETRLFDSGTAFLQQGEYDKAEKVFNQLITIKPSDPELYWALALCKYGITFVQDPQSKKYIPTCNRTHFESILNDKNYLNAIKYSNEGKKAYYKETAELINNIQKNIISISQKEKPFDIFISYKETDKNGNRTKDSIIAQDIYNKLTEAGYNVFFSRITLESKIGSEYEPYIYAALCSSKVMLTISSSREFIEAPWVKNEWSRFLVLRQSDTSKNIIPLYFAMDKTDLPNEFSLFPAYNIEEPGFDQELFRGIKKLIPLPIMLARQRKKRRKILTITAVFVFAAVLIGAAIYLPYYINDLQCAEQYAEAETLFNDKAFEKASAIFQALGNYKDSEIMIRKCEQQPIYDTASQLYYAGNYPLAFWEFSKVPDFEDAEEMKTKAEQSWRKSLATVITSDPYVLCGNCFINENGSLSVLNSGYGGELETDIDISKHGKIISVDAADGSMTLAIHGDGNVSTTSKEIQLDSAEWHNIIKLKYALATGGIIALRNDGKILTNGISHDSYSKSAWSKWTEEIASWSDIIDFEYIYCDSYDEWLIGIKADGSICYKINCSSFPFISESHAESGVRRVLNQFDDIKTIKISVDTMAKTSSLIMDVVALTKDGELISYIDGNFSREKADDICDIISTEFVLKKNGDFVELKTGKILQQDIIYAKEGFLVTRTGTISGKTIKTAIYNEWISRLD